MKKFFYITAAVTAAVITASVIAAAAAFYSFNMPSDGIPAEGIRVNVSSGESLSRIADNLRKNNVIRSSLLLRITSRLKGTEQSFKSGEYLIMPGKSTLEIHDIIVSGSGILYKVTIPEGYTASGTAALLEKNKITDIESFMAAVESKKIMEKYNISADSLEGFLYPDSYLFSQGYPAEKVVDFMVNNFFINLEKIYPLYNTLTSEDIYDKIILASIIEREYRVPEEAPLISSVFINRLDIRMPLGSCATVGYIITEIQDKPHPEFITYDDIKIESDYNTYINYGLPPSPICSPGKIALSAAFYPAQSDYLYFLLKDRSSGEHYFSRRLSEHNEARFLYLKK